jgi:peptidoglycan/xylan/chitin deacetylase (PgdA/CDA1 family)
MGTVETARFGRTENLMTDGLHRQRVAIVTTSWDDGHPLDMRVAELLATYRMVGTFYVPLSGRTRPLMTREQLQALRHMRMEIGSHTMMHHELTKIAPDKARLELMQSKDCLEQLLGEPVTSLCYPKGKFNRKVRSLTAEAGYSLARTTLAFRTNMDFDPLCMPVSLQVFPHTVIGHIRHAVKQNNIRGMVNWYALWCLENDPVKLARLIVDHIQNYGGICHIWGHSWEIEQCGLWKMLEEILQQIAHRQQVRYLTNAQVLQQIRP